MFPIPFYIAMAATAAYIVVTYHFQTVLSRLGDPANVECWRRVHEFAWWGVIISAAAFAFTLVS